MDIDRRDTVLKALQLRESTARPSLSRVIGKTIRGLPRTLEGEPPVTIFREKFAYPKALGWFDHTEILWHRMSGTHVLISQPYDLTDDQFYYLEALAYELGLTAQRSVGLSWWMPGYTTLVIVHRQVEELQRAIIESEDEATLRRRYNFMTTALRYL